MGIAAGPNTCRGHDASQYPNASRNTDSSEDSVGRVGTASSGDANSDRPSDGDGSATYSPRNSTGTGDRTGHATHASAFAVALYPEAAAEPPAAGTGESGGHPPSAIVGS